MAYVYSTLSCDNEYRSYGKGGGDIQNVVAHVLIRGGAGIANKNILTPKGVATQVTNEELAILESNDQFKLHVANGFIIVENKKAEADEVAKNMTKKDKSAPATPEDYVGDKKPITKEV